MKCYNDYLPTDNYHSTAELFRSKNRGVNIC